MNVKDAISEVSDIIRNNSNSKAVFGDPIEKGNITIIPVSKVCVFGGGKNAPTNEEEEKTSSCLCSRIKTTPIGYIQIDNEGAKFVEITQQSKIILASIALGAFSVFSLTRILLKYLKKH